ncbi:MAG: class I SAM-dependent methyltransferase [Candidatus Eisenbacteria bacterium]
MNAPRHDEDALTRAKELVEETAAAHTDALYDVARLHALRGQEVDAYAWLYRAVGAGFWDVKRLREDEAFDAYREGPSFVRFMRGAWANGYRLMLDHEEREGFQKPEEVVPALELKPGMRVAEVGPGSGYFTVRIAKAVGDTGTVRAHDAAQEMLDYLERRLAWERLDNVALRKVGREDPELPEGAADLILLVDVLHYVQDLPDYAGKLRKGLAPGGRIAVVDYRPKPWEERPWGPPPAQQIDRQVIDDAMASAGLGPIQVHEFLPEQYFVIYGAADD